ncbi:monocarboxylate transporter 12-like [Ptychodera flava]|uniref:monocarboxylate transporter 12-like n=1 Tax=Ptychodera flava TaxID=63121 RepID=UPI00396AA5A4
MGDANKYRGCEPPDGGYGWVVVAAGFVVFFIAGGTFAVGGIFVVEFMEYFKQGAAQAAWIGALFGVNITSIGPLAGLMTTHFGSRPTVMFGGFLSTIGFVLSSFAPSLKFLYLSYGVCIGWGFGIAVIPTVVIISEYFRKRYAIANGITFTGAAIGTLVLPPIYNILIREYYWWGALLLAGGLSAQLMVCGALMRPLSLRMRGSQRNKHLQNKVRADDQNRTGVANVNEQVVSLLGRETDAHLQNDKKTYNTTSSGTWITDKSILDSSNFNLKRKIRQKLENFFSMIGITLFMEYPTFTIICIAQFLEGFGWNTAITLLVARAVSSGISKMDASLMLTVLGATSLLGRTCHGIIVDHGLISPIRLFGIAIAIGGVGMLLNPLTNIYGILVALAALLGLSSGTYQPLVPVSIRACIGEQHLSTGVGLDYFIMGIGYVAGPPFSGWLYDTMGDYKAAFFVAGATLLAGGILIILAPCLGSLCSRNADRQSNIHSEKFHNVV